MKKKWQLIEKLIITTLILFGIIVIYSVFEYTFRVKNNAPSITYIQLIVNQIYFIFLGVSLPLSGIFMLINKKIGWILSIPLLFSIPIIGTINYMFFPDKFFDHSNQDIILACGIMILILFIVCILLTKYFRDKYNSNYRDYFIMSILILLFSASEFFN